VRLAVVVFKGERGYSYCADKAEKYYGFEDHWMIDSRGIISGFTLANTAIDECDVVQEVTQSICGLLIGDKGYIRPLLTEKRLNKALIYKHLYEKT
jgi:hypothetical protein